MPQQKIINGYIVQRNDDGTFTTLGPATQGQTYGQPAPDYQYKAPKAAADVQNTQANAQGQQIQNTVAAATTEAQIREAKAKADKAVLDAQAAASEQASKPDPSQAKQIRGLQLDEVLRAIDGARRQVSPWSTGLGGQILQPIGGTQARDLSGDISTIGSALTVDKLQQMKAQSQTGASGMGALSEKEGALLRDSVASLDQAQSEGKVKQSLDAIELHYRRLRAIQDGQNPDDPQVQKAYGIPTPDMKAPSVGGGGNGPQIGGPTPLTGPGGPGSGPQMSLAQGDYKTVEDPLRAGLNAKVSEMVSSGKSADEIRSYIKSAGIDPSTVTGIDGAVEFRKKYPSYKGNYPVDIQTKQVPLGTLGSIVNKLGQSGLGAYAINAADALTAGTLDNMTSNPEASRAAMSAISDQHPYASIGGMITGGALAASGLEGLAAKAGLSAIPAAMATDAAYGGAYGAGSSDNGNRVTGALKGAALGLGGGMVGRGAVRAAGGLVRGVSDPAKRLLNEAGVRMSIPQMAGGKLKAAEDWLSGLPGAGSLVNGTRRAALKDFQKAAFNEALAPIGQQGISDIGEQGIGQAQDAVSNAFQDALGGVTVQTDAPFKQAMSKLIPQTMQRPRVGPELASSMNEIASPMFGPGGTLRGVDAQPIWQGLDQLGAGYRRGGDPLYSTQVAPAINDYGGQIEGLFQRQAPDVIPALRNAKDANRNVSILQDAVLAAQAKPGEMAGQFTPSQLMTASKNNAIRFSGRRSAAAGRGSLFGLARAGNQVLPQTIPDSGTAGRLALYGLLGGTYGASDYASGPEDKRSLGGSAAKALALATALAAASKGARPLVQKAAFSGRGEKAQVLGDWLLAHPELGGGAAVPLLLPQN